MEFVVRSCDVVNAQTWTGIIPKKKEVDQSSLVTWR